MKFVTIELLVDDAQTGYLAGSRRVMVSNAAQFMIKRGIAKVIDGDSQKPKVVRRKAKRASKPASPVDGHQEDPPFATE